MEINIKWNSLIYLLLNLKKKKMPKEVEPMLFHTSVHGLAAGH